MDLELILKRLGVASGEAALAAIDRWNNMLASLMTLCSVTAPQAAMEMLQQTHKALGGFGPEALARVEAWRASAERVPELETELNTLRTQQLDSQANGLIQQATQDGRLRPAQLERAQSFYKEHGIGALQAFLEAMPAQGNPSLREVRQPPPNNERSPQMIGAEDRVYMKATGRTSKQIDDAQKLWDSTQGVMDDAHIEELDQKQRESFKGQRVLRVG